MSPAFCKLDFSYQGAAYSLSKCALKDEKATLNLQRLFERKKGTLFRVNEEGLLTEVEGWKGWLSYQWSRQKERAEVKKVVNGVLSQFNDFLSSLTDQKVAMAAARYLFDREGANGIGRLGKALYSRTLTKTDNVLSKYLLPPNTVRLKIGDHQFIDITDKKLEGKQIPFPVHIDLRDPALNYNLFKLLKRKKGQIFRLSGEGKLEKVSNRFTYRWNKEANEARVQAATSVTLEYLNNFFAKIEMTEVHQFVLEKIFSADSSLCRMNRRVFCRGAIEEGSFIESRLAPRLKTRRESVAEASIELKNATTNAQNNSAKRHLERQFLDFAFDEFRFAQKLGLDLIPIENGGSGGAKYALDRHGNTILVVKPTGDGPNDPGGSWFRWLKSFLVSTKPCLEGNSEAQAEVDAWFWDRTFQIWTVPPTDIRYVSSVNFVGGQYKECSIQMYVEGCETLGNYVGVSSKLQWLPRRFLRWYCGSRFNTGIFYSIGQREGRKAELLNKLPQNLIEKAAIGDAGVENLDCHLENILVRLEVDSQENCFMKRLFGRDASLRDKEVADYMADFFKTKKNQSLLANLFSSETIVVDGIKKKITLITIDKGASNPNKHPGFLDILSKRNMSLFEILPHFEEPFSDDARALLKGKKDKFIQFLLAKGTSNLRNVMQKEVFEEFWKVESNRRLLKMWICETDEEMAYTHQLNLITACVQASIKVKKEDFRQLLTKQNRNGDERTLNRLVGVYIKENGRKIEYYFDDHLNRIRGTLQTRIDSFRILKKHTKNKDQMMRTFFKEVKDSTDFENQKRELDDSFETVLGNWGKRNVKFGEATPRKEQFLHASTLFEDLGEILK